MSMSLCVSLRIPVPVPAGQGGPGRAVSPPGRGQPQGRLRRFPAAFAFVSPPGPLVPGPSQRDPFPVGSSSRWDPPPGGIPVPLGSRPGGAAMAGRGTRTVVIAGVPAGLLQDELLADLLTIHFQMSRNNGGDVQRVTYPARDWGTAFVTFEDAGVVERVLKKDQHILQDKRLPRPFPLTVTPYCHNAFLCVTSTLNVAVFRDHLVLEDLVEEMKQQSPALSFGPLQRDGQIAVQGSFPALRVLRDFLLLKAKSLSEEDRREGKSHQKPRRKLQEHRGAAEMRNSTRDAHREKQVLVLDTDIYHYMKCFHPRAFQGNAVVISGVTDGDITTVCIESAGSRAGAAQGLKAKKMIESYSVELQKVLRKERICFKEPSRAGRQRHRQLCEKLKARYPRVLLIPYDTHLDLVGTSADVFGFAEELKRHSR
ncbi:RNA-binding protein 43 isoform X2 [Serinus canaria]|uniref:RNA-binding protein 43 isoform X2 n=1 Tax=Serinus canaria TaxID=9135 RepID=UPI0021CC7C64|nr:RNA-binding protein 43 isoform X2 [Serinus canaria]